MPNQKHVALLLTLSLVGLAACAGPAALAQPLAGLSAPGTGPAAARAGGQLPMYFVENRGQTDARVRFLARTPQGGVFFTDTAVVAPISFELEGSSPGAKWRPSEPTGETKTYRVGRDPRRWTDQVPAWFFGYFVRHLAYRYSLAWD